MPVWSLLALGAGALLAFWMVLVLLFRVILTGIGEDLTETLDPRP
jgi:hypothetical protein